MARRRLRLCDFLFVSYRQTNNMTATNTPKTKKASKPAKAKAKVLTANDYKVVDLGLAEFGRKEMKLARWKCRA